MTAACHDDCLETGEPLIGSAGQIAAWLGVRWPKPLWHSDDASRSSGLPAALYELERAQKALGQKVSIRTYQREPHPSTDRVEVIALEPGRERCERAQGVPLRDLVDTLESFLAGSSIGAPLERPTLLICTDGKHDRCCATHGRPLFQAARSAAREHEIDLDVLESSHLGGHRFASTALSLPDGRLYGRVRAAGATDLVEAIAAGHVLAAHDRGRLGRPELQQLAEAALRTLHPAATPLEAKVTSEAPAPGESEQVRLQVEGVAAGSEQHLEVECRRDRFHSPSSCDGEATTRARWTLVRVDPR